MIGSTVDRKAQEIAVRAYEMYKSGDLSEEQAAELFDDQFDDVKQMVRCDEIIRNQPDPDPNNDDLFRKT